MGALTSKPHAFVSRPWEIRKINNIGIIDAWAYNIVIGYRGTEVIRILPDTTDSNHWIPDTTRYMYDGLRKNRLFLPSLHMREERKGVLIDWIDAIQLLNYKLKKRDNEVYGIVGFSVDVVSYFIFKHVVETAGGFGLLLDSYNNYRPVNIDFRQNYLYKCEPYKEFKDTQLVLTIGLNTRVEAPVLSARLLKKKTTMQLISLLCYESTFACFTMAVQDITHFFKGAQPLCNAIVNVNELIIIRGPLSSYYGLVSMVNMIYGLVNYVYVMKRVGYAHLYTILQYANQGAFYEIGIDMSSRMHTTESASFIMLSSDESMIKDADSVTYIGSHADLQARAAQLLIPRTGYLEEEEFFINTEGKLQKTAPFAKAMPQARYTNVKLLQLLHLLMIMDARPYPYRIWLQIVELGTTYTIYPIIPLDNRSYKSKEQVITDYGVTFIINRCLYDEMQTDPYTSNYILRSSPLLAMASKYLRKKENIFI